MAVDPNVIPLRSKLYVPGYGYASAEDIGGAIQGNRIDLFMDTLGQRKNPRTPRIFPLSKGQFYPSEDNTCIAWLAYHFLIFGTTNLSPWPSNSS
ncbi:MAG: 3D domain-containing protein [Bacillota bacterium]